MSDDLKNWHDGYHCRDHQVADLERMLRAAQSALTEQHAANARLQAERNALAEQLNSVTSMAERFGQERDALTADAERYRWLRDGDGTWSTRWSRWRIEHWASPGPTWSDIRGTDLDAAIDAARKEGEG